MIESAAPGPLQRPAIQQFIKFCIIGATSTVIDAAISYTLTYHYGINQTLAKSISFVFSVSNGFFWNSRWTFRGMGSGRLHEMYTKFIAINIVGLILNLTLFKLVQVPFSGRFIGQGRPSKPVFFLAFLTATFFVAFWNFTANRKWTFKPADATDPAEYPVRANP